MEAPEEKMESSPQRTYNETLFRSASTADKNVTSLEFNVTSDGDMTVEYLLNQTPADNPYDPEYPFLAVTQEYDYMGASLFVTGILTVYGIAILLFIISLIRKSRAELELVDHLEDFEAIRRASLKRKTRDSLRSSFGESTPGNSLDDDSVPRRQPPRRPLVRSQRIEEDDDDSNIWLQYHGRRGFRHPAKLISYNPGLLRDDTYDKEDTDFIIV